VRAAELRTMPGHEVTQVNAADVATVGRVEYEGKPYVLAQLRNGHWFLLDAETVQRMSDALAKGVTGS